MQYHSDWLFKSLQYIDFDVKTLLIECGGIMRITYGGFPFSDLREMEFDEYELLISECQEFLKRSKEEGI